MNTAEMEKFVSLLFEEGEEMGKKESKSERSDNRSDYSSDYWFQNKIPSQFEKIIGLERMVNLKNSFDEQVTRYNKLHSQDLWSKKQCLRLFSTNCGKITSMTDISLI
jgi:hypothetical protein